MAVFPMEGRMVHEGAPRYGVPRPFRPMTFSMAYNDYGFELLSDVAIPITEAFDSGLFKPPT